MRTPLRLALPFEPPDNVTIKNKSTESIGAKAAVPEACGQSELAKAVRPLEHTGEPENTRGNVPPRHAISVAAIVPVPVTCPPRSENDSPVIKPPPGSTVIVKTIQNDFVSDEAAKNSGAPLNRVNSKPALSGELRAVGYRTSVIDGSPPNPVINLSPTSQPFG